MNPQVDLGESILVVPARFSDVVANRLGEKFEIIEAVENLLRLTGRQSAVVKLAAGDCDQPTTEQ